MSADLDTRLRSLSELSPASHAPLGASELHRRATRRQQRTIALRAVPAVVVVVALLAGALALANRTGTTDVVVGPPETTAAPDASAVSDRDRQILSFLRSTVELRHQIDREMVLSSVYASTDGTGGRPELEAQRVATDVAMRAYTDGAASVTSSSGTASTDEAALIQAIAQADSRVERLDVNRRAVDAIQADAYALIDAYRNLTLALQAIPAGYLQSLDDPAVFRGVLSAANLGQYATTTAAGAAWLTVAVEIGYYAGVVPKGADPTVLPADCGIDAEGAGDACVAYAGAIELDVERERLDANFHSYANGSQKQIFRAASTPSAYDQLRRTAFEDGSGINDIRGMQPRSVPIDPVEWRAEVLAHLDRLADAERQLLDQVGTHDQATPSGSGSEPGDRSSPASATATLPAPPSTDTTTPAPTTVGTSSEIIETDRGATGRSETERITETAPSAP